MAPPLIALRATAFLLATLVVTPPYALLAWSAWPLPARLRYRIVTSWSRIVVRLARIVCGIRWQVRGRLPENGPYIVLAKHQSAWETLFLQLLLPPQVHVLKRWLLWLPFFGWGLATLSPITIERTPGPRTLRRLLERGSARLRDGFWVVVFPEGTRVRPGARGSYRPGGAWLACKTGIAVLPIAHNAGELWPRNGFMKYPGTITVSIGTPIDSRDSDPERLTQSVARWIEREMTTLPPARHR